MSERYRQLYLEHVFDLLDGPRREEIVARAHRLISLWRNTAHMAPHYATRWTEILAMPLDLARATVFADSQDGDLLRHCTPFAGVVDNRQRAQLRRIAKTQTSC